MAAVQQSATAMPCVQNKCLRVNNTFIEMVNDNAPDSVRFRRVNSDPGVYDKFAEICTPRGYYPEEQHVNFALTGLSDAESEVDTTATAHNVRVRPCGSVTCSTRSTSPSHGDGESGLDSDYKVGVDLVQDISSYVYANECSHVSTPIMFPMYQPSGACLLYYDLDEPASLPVPPVHSSAVGAHFDCAGSVSGSERTSAERLSDENKRLAAENNLLRENMRLARENQALEAAFAAACGSNASSHMRATTQPRAVEKVSRRRSSLRADPVGASTLGVAGKVGGAKNATPPSSPGRKHQDDTRTTVLWLNLPNKYTRAMLLKLLDESGFSGLYDFFYMPIDLKTHASLGHAFINFTSPSVVQRFWRHFEGYSEWAIPSKNASYVNWSDPHQGFTKIVDRYRNCPIMHESVPDEYKPVVFVNGVRMCFPAPTRKPRAPRYCQS